MVLAISYDGNSKHSTDVGEGGEGVGGAATTLAVFLAAGAAWWRVFGARGGRAGRFGATRASMPALRRRGGGGKRVD